MHTKIDIYIYIYLCILYKFTAPLPPNKKVNVPPKKVPRKKTHFLTLLWGFSPCQLLETTHPNSPWATKIDPLSNFWLVHQRIQVPSKVQGVGIALRRPYPYCISKVTEKLVGYWWLNFWKFCSLKSEATSYNLSTYLQELSIKPIWIISWTYRWWKKSG